MLAPQKLMWRDRRSASCVRSNSSTSVGRTCALHHAYPNIPRLELDPRETSFRHSLFIPHSLSMSHQSISHEMQQAVQEDLVYALATGDIDFAACPPSLIWSSIPAEIRSSIEMCPSPTENQHMEAGGDALLGELMFDLLTYWCPKAPTSFIVVRPYPFNYPGLVVLM